jgi:CHAT domain-containing protein
MCQKLYPIAKCPDGHHFLAALLCNVGSLLMQIGQAEQALPYVQQSLEMQQRLLRRELAIASEEAAFDEIQAQPRYRDAYLGIAQQLKTPAEIVYGIVWPSRSMMTRVLEQRHANARTAGTELGAQLDRLRGLRRRTDQLLQDTKMKTAERDNRLATVADERDRLERELLQKMPTLQHWRELDKLSPTDLLQALPPGAVFVDIIRYTHFANFKQKDGLPAHYVAFVVTKPTVGNASGSAILRVELHEAKPIDTAVRQWRAAIEIRSAAPDAVAELQRRVWEKIAAALPVGTKTLYIAADGDLARMPWAALPSGKDHVLLEDFALAQVPHGTYLLDQLKSRKKFEGPGSVLTMGDVDYGSSIWPPLSNTGTEAKAIAALVHDQQATLAGKDATLSRLQELLPRARFAHLATHGEFKAEELTKERKRAKDAIKTGAFGGDSRNVAAKNPLGYVGLVLANGEILSGLGIVDLPLENLKLVTLSACETGLGEYTGGEGVQGLQRAFHLAGCPNVIASLWNVNDAATAALMAKFYHELWINKKPPIEALREAQLTIYYHPEMIPDLAGERGAPKLKEAVTVNSGRTPDVSPGVKRADTKLWAAFVLSGVGK